MEQKPEFNDKTLMADCLMSQKHMGELYNSFIMESGTQELRRDVMDIHRQELDNTHRIFQTMNSRGWYRPLPADQQTLDQIKSEMQASPGGGGAGGGARGTGGGDGGTRTTY